MILECGFVYILSAWFFIVFLCVRRVVFCGVVLYEYRPKGEGRMAVEMWHYFTVVDVYTGLDRGFRWREAVCGYCGVAMLSQLMILYGD
jgi:hypothetical protein